MNATSHTVIGSFEAKTKFSEILRKIELGERFTVTKRGRAVADIVPSGQRDPARVRQAAETLRTFPRITGVSGDDVLEWIREGRK